MNSQPPVLSVDRPQFGRRATVVRAGGIADDLRLFAISFAAGFLFLSIYLG